MDTLDEAKFKILSFQDRIKSSEFIDKSNHQNAYLDPLGYALEALFDLSCDIYLIERTEDEQLELNLLILDVINLSIARFFGTQANYYPLEWDEFDAICCDNSFIRNRKLNSLYTDSIINSGPRTTDGMLYWTKNISRVHIQQMEQILEDINHFQFNKVNKQITTLVEIGQELIDGGEEMIGAEVLYRAGSLRFLNHQRYLGEYDYLNLPDNDNHTERRQSEFEKSVVQSLFPDYGSVQYHSIEIEKDGKKKLMTYKAYGEEGDILSDCAPIKQALAQALINLGITRSMETNPEKVMVRSNSYSACSLF